jgi:hypothetical protein
MRRGWKEKIWGKKERKAGMWLKGTKRKKVKDERGKKGYRKGGGRWNIVLYVVEAQALQ